MTADARRGMGELERMVMVALWDAGRPMTPREVLERLDADPPVTYSTTMTILRRLWSKGVVAREKVGKAFAYAPLRDREAETATRMADLLAATRDANTALGHFVGELSPAQRRQLRRLLERR